MKLKFSDVLNEKISFSTYVKHLFSKKPSNAGQAFQNILKIMKVETPVVAHFPDKRLYLSKDGERVSFCLNEDGLIIKKEDPILDINKTVIGFHKTYSITPERKVEIHSRMITDKLSNKVNIVGETYKTIPQKLNYKNISKFLRI